MGWQIYFDYNYFWPVVFLYWKIFALLVRLRANGIKCATQALSPEPGRTSEPVALFSCSNNVDKVKTHSAKICFAFFSSDFTFTICFDNISRSWLLIWLYVLELLGIKSHTLAISRFLYASPTAFISWPREALWRLLIIVKASFPWIWSKTCRLSWLVIIWTLLPERNVSISLELTYIIRLILLCLIMRLMWLILWILI